MRPYLFYRIDPPGAEPRLVRLGQVSAWSVEDAVRVAANRWPDTYDPGKPYGGFAVILGNRNAAE